MTPDDCANLSSAISAWFDQRFKEGVPGPVMCEAFMMLPLTKWLLSHGFLELKPERSHKGQPYHAFDLRAERNKEEYLFDLKFFRNRRKFSWKHVGKDLGELGSMKYSAMYRYCVVTSEKESFPFNLEDVTKDCKAFLDNDGWRHIVVSPKEIVVREEGAYITMICRVRHA